jgi:hypothetical protein
MTLRWWLPPSVRPPDVDQVLFLVALHLWPRVHQVAWPVRPSPQTPIQLTLNWTSVQMAQYAPESSLGTQPNL